MPAPDLLEIASLDRTKLTEMLDLAERADLGRPLEGKGVALYFQKPSARTRNSMEMAVFQLGGHPVYIQKDEIGIGTRESVEDVAHTLGCFYSIICARVMEHGLLTGMADAVDTPVVNLLSDRAHPLQALADLLTVRQLLGRLEGVKIAYIGDANNVARSLAEGCSLLGLKLDIASPAAYGLESSELALLNAQAGEVRQVEDPEEAVEGAEIVYTDVWVSMGQDGEAAERQRAFAAYQVDEALMERAAPAARFLHCLPAIRGQEVAAKVMDGPRSAVWQQAENRMHSARGALAWLMGVRP